MGENNRDKRQETRDKRQETRDKRQETRDKRQETREGRVFSVTRKKESETKIDKEGCGDVPCATTWLVRKQHTREPSQNQLYTSPS